MLINNKNYKYLDIDKFIAMIDEEEEMNNIRIVDGYSAVLGESFIYGEYEYSGGNTVVFPGELFKSWTTERVISSGTYSGTVDACGNVTLSPDLDSVDVNHYIYRRDLTSLEDELKRYAEYCFIYISAIDNISDQEIENAEASGGNVDLIIYKFKEVLVKVDWERARKEVPYVIGIKKILCAMYETHYKKPFIFSNYGKNIYYPFISKVMAPGEKQYLDKEHIREREKVHFSYLEEAASKIEGFALGKNPHKSGMYVVSIVFLSFWGFMTAIGLVSGIVSALKNGDQPFLQSLGVGAYFAFLAAPFFVIGLIFAIVTGVKYKKYKKFNKQYEDLVKQ